MYPIREDFEEDINKQTLYVVYEETELVALYVISAECDDAYKNGTWKYQAKPLYTKELWRNVY